MSKRLTQLVCSFQLIRLNLVTHVAFLEQADTLHDPTLLPLVRERFIQIRESLLSDPIVYSKHDGRLLSRFREKHASSAFVCRFAQCEKSVRGFDDAASRDRHESAHHESYRCREPGCASADWKFPNKRSLVAHSKRYHSLEKPVSMHQWNPIEPTGHERRKLDEISDLPYLYEVHGHDWLAIARLISTPEDPKTAHEVSLPPNNESQQTAERL